MATEERRTEIIMAELKNWAERLRTDGEKEKTEVDGLLRVMADLAKWAQLHDREPIGALTDAVEAYLRNQGAAGYAEIHEL